MRERQRSGILRRVRLRTYGIGMAVLLLLALVFGTVTPEKQVASEQNLAESKPDSNIPGDFDPEKVVVEEPVPPSIEWRSGSFAEKPIFNQLLDQGLTGYQVQNLINALTPYYNFRKARPQHQWHLGFLEDQPHAFVLEVTATEIYDVDQLEENPNVVQREVETYVVEEIIRGDINGSLFQSLDHVRKPMRLGLKLADVFAWDIDFNRDTQNGDRFEILVESRFIKTEAGPVFNGYGDILAARYHGLRKTYHATLYKPPGEEKGYFNQLGESLIRDVLRSPLKVQIVTSKFQRNRFHPILKKNKPHNGVDYRANKGTPVMAVASGKVLRAGRYGGAGIMVELKHKDKMETQYMHLSKIANGVRSGSTVRQGQVIGFVGKTGYATSYHLHFGMKIRGKYVDPQQQKFQPGKPIRKDQMEEFQQHMREMMARLEPQAQSYQVLGLAPDLVKQYSGKVEPFTIP